MADARSLWYGVAYVLSVACLLFVLIVTGCSEETDAGHTHIPGDWYISNGTTRFENWTVDVAGNVTVGNGGRLVLENSTLLINTSVPGNGLFVEPGGVLVVRNSTVEGDRWTSAMRVRGDLVVVGSRIWNFLDVSLEDGNATISSSILFSENIMEVMTDLFLEKTSLWRLRLKYNHGSPARNISWHLKDWTTNWVGIESLSVHGYTTTAVIENASFSYIDYPLMITMDEGLDITVGRCSFFENRFAVTVHQYQGGAARIVNNTLVGPGRDEGWSTGIRCYVQDRPAIRISGNAVSEFDAGYSFFGKGVPWCEASFGNLTARDCRCAVMAGTSQQTVAFYLSVHNSTFSNYTTCFEALEGGYIRVYDTECTPGSAFAQGSMNWVRGFATLSISNIGWRDGGPITSGKLTFLDEGGERVTSTDVESLRPMHFLGWEVTRDASWRHMELTPCMMTDVWVFHGEEVDIWGPMPVDVTMVDDFVPVIDLLYPVQGEVHGTTHPTAIGKYYEMGSGLSSMSYVLDGSDTVEFRDFSGGHWALLLSGLRDGEHTLTVWGVDGVGNVAERVPVSFQVDSTPPHIDLEGVPDIINTSPMFLAGRTEPRATLTVVSMEIVVDADGSFSFTYDLKEGLNTLRIWVVDQAGHKNSTTLQVVLDTVPPALRVTNPEGGTWTNSSSVVVEGSSEPGARVELNGMAAPLSDHRFNHTVQLAEGEFLIRVTATDLAGNVAWEEMVLFVDWQAPVIELEVPDVELTYTTDASLTILGTVQDTALEVLLVNGEEVQVLDGTFLRRFTLAEGLHRFDILARDHARNQASTSIVVVMDITPPRYQVLLVPEDGDLIDTEAGIFSPCRRLEVVINASEEARVNLNGVEEGPGRNVSFVLDLVEGPNRLNLSIRDLAGNEGESLELEVIVDTRAPPLKILSPGEGIKTKDERMTIRGLTEPGVFLSINDVSYAVEPDASFTQKFLLEIGVNEFQVVVVDRAGHSNRTTIVVHREEPDGDSRAVIVGPWSAVVVALVVIIILAWVWWRRGREF